MPPAHINTAQHLAGWIESTGDPQDVVACSRRDPQPLPLGSVRVRMDAAAINPSDLMFIRGEYGIAASPPQSPGFEGVGRIVEANAGIYGRVLNGRRVVVLHPSGGTWSSEVVLCARRVIPIGETLSTNEAATFFVNPATAWVLCKRVLGLKHGDTLLQTAGSSNLGRMIVRLGVREGIRTVSLVRREEQVSDLKALGADDVISFDIEKQSIDELALRLRSVGLLQSITAAIDPVGGPIVPALISVLADRARLILYGSLSDEPWTVSSRHLLTASQAIEGFWLARWMEQVSLLQKIRLTRTLKRLHVEGVTTTETYRVFDLADVRSAVLAAANQHSGEKVILRCSTGND